MQVSRPRCGVLILLLLTLGGCAVAPRGEAFQPEIADDSKAVVYIFREPRTLGGREVSIYLNQTHRGELGPGQYLAEVVPPGEYFVRAENGGSAVRQATVRAGDAVYFRIHAGRFGRSITIDLPPSTEARRIIARTTRTP